jgi:hypothetical protein
VVVVSDDFNFVVEYLLQSIYDNWENIDEMIDTVKAYKILSLEKESYIISGSDHYYSKNDPILLYKEDYEKGYLRILHKGNVYDFVTNTLLNDI